MKNYLTNLLMIALFGVVTPLSSNAQNSIPPQGDCENLFISEITFGKNPNGNLWDLNYAVEIYNPTQNAINLAGYELLLTDLTQNTLSIPLSGTLSGGDVYVVCNDNADLNLQGMADQLASGMDFELYASLELKQGTVVLDKIGQNFSNNPNTNFDPVQLAQDPYGYLQNYDINLDDYENITLRRGYFEKKGDPIFSPALHAMVGHWYYVPNVDRSDIGQHASECYYTPEANFRIGYLQNSANNSLFAHLTVAGGQYPFGQWPLSIYHPDWPPNYMPPANPYPFTYHSRHVRDNISTASFGFSTALGFNNVGYYIPSTGQAVNADCNITKTGQSQLVGNCESVQFNSPDQITPPSSFVKLNLQSNTTGVDIDPTTQSFWIYFYKYPTAVNSFNTDKVQVYPTIFYDNISVKSAEGLNYKVMNLSGQLLQQGDLQLQENIIQLAHLSSGIYLLGLWDANGNSHTVKIQKK